MLLVATQPKNLLLKVLSLALLGAETKTHTKVNLLRWVQQVLGYGGLSCALGEVLMDVMCRKMCLKLDSFRMSSHMVGTVGDPMSYLTCWLGHDLFQVKMLNQCM